MKKDPNQGGSLFDSILCSRWCSCFGMIDGVVKDEGCCDVGHSTVIALVMRLPPPLAADNWGENGPIGGQSEGYRGEYHGGCQAKTYGKSGRRERSRNRVIGEFLFDHHPSRG